MDSREQFKAKVLRLRKQFEQFNVDASELCQWLMGLRPGGKRGMDATKDFWEFFLEPKCFLDEAEKEKSDRYRRMVLDVAGGGEQQDKNKWLTNKRRHKFRCEGCVSEEFFEGVFLGGDLGKSI